MPATPTGWISTKAEMPDSDQTVIVHSPGADEPVWLGFHDGETWRDVNTEQINVTHWLPLMEPPTESES
jgi:hypothetical protein